MLLLKDIAPHALKLRDGGEKAPCCLGWVPMRRKVFS